MAEKFTHSMRLAFREVWPEVQHSLAKPPGRRPMTIRKAAVTEAMWALARAGWLRSAADRDVIQAAQGWAAAVSPEYYEDYPEEKALYEATQRLPERESA